VPSIEDTRDGPSAHTGPPDRTAAQECDIRDADCPASRDELVSRGLLGRAVGVLKFIASRGSVSLPEMAVATGLPKSSVHRLVQELVREGVLIQRHNRYAVAPLVFEFGLSSPELRLLREAALPVMEDIYEFTHHIVHLAILVEDADAPQALVLEKIMGRRSSIISSRAGLRIPLHSSAAGKILLAFSGPAILEQTCAGPLPRFGPNTIVTGAALRQEVERIRRTRFSIANEEGSEGTKCVAAPIFGRANALRGALSITVTDAVPVDFENLGAVVRVAAQAVTRELEMRGTENGGAATSPNGPAQSAIRGGLLGPG